MRLVRFSGAAEVFWPIGMHMLLVADLMPRQVYAGPSDAPANPWMEVYGLLHDAAEVCVGDVPRPMKTAEARALEDRVQSRIYAALGVPEPTAAVTAAIKEADFRAALAEGLMRMRWPGLCGDPNRIPARQGSQRSVAAVHRRHGLHERRTARCERLLASLV